MQRLFVWLRLMLFSLVIGCGGVPEDPTSVPVDECVESEEICDFYDNDCDGAVDESGANALTWFVDLDGDGYGNPQVTQTTCQAPENYVDNSADCNDSDAQINPDAQESCDSVDNNCDGEIDESGAQGETIWYADMDGDGYGALDSATSACQAPQWHVSNSDDCNDADVDVNPAVADLCDGIDNDCDGLVDDDVETLEICDGVDNDCDGQIDEPDAEGVIFWYADSDRDQYGDPNVTLSACKQPMSYVQDNTDCDDTNQNVNPGAPEICGDAIDNDCNPLNDEDGSVWYLDADEDGYGDSQIWTVSCEEQEGYVLNAGDCDDSDPYVQEGYPWFADVDQDGLGDPKVYVIACEEPEGYVDNPYDCDDSNAQLGDGVWSYLDADEDGYGNPYTGVYNCQVSSDAVLTAGDCDDSDPKVHPNADEYCDEIDNDCDGQKDEPDSLDASTWYIDNDEDGYGGPSSTAVSCTQPYGYVQENGDCNDLNPAVSPNSVEICNWIDDNCNGLVDDADTNVDPQTFDTWYQDSDSDGYGNVNVTAQACEPPVGFVESPEDCNDLDENVNPGASELCNDGLDNDCNPANDLDGSTWYADADGDGYGSVSNWIMSCEEPDAHVLNAQDCDDGDSDVNPSATEYCDEIDNDCDGTTDMEASDAQVFYLDSDADGYGDPDAIVLACEVPEGYEENAEDCAPLNAEVHPGASEYCDGMDNNCDGKVDDGSSLDAQVWYADADHDGHGDPESALTSCSTLFGYVSSASDCDDTNPAVADGIWSYPDMDEDGYGEASGGIYACELPQGFITTPGDCDDLDEEVNPEAEEICDEIDNNCDGQIDENLMSAYWIDEDGDGYGSPEQGSQWSCEPIEGSVTNSNDCDDSRANVSPGDYEVYFDPQVPGSGLIYCDDGLDNDCDGATDQDDVQCEDADHDGIPDGIDHLFPCDPNQDGNNEAACIWASQAWNSPWSSASCIQQPWPYTTLSSSSTNAPQSVSWAGNMIEICPIYPTALGNQDWRAVSSLGESGTAVNVTDCSDWVPANIQNYCAEFGDTLCTTSSLSDGCEVVGKVLSFSWDGVNVTP